MKRRMSSKVTEIWYARGMDGEMRGGGKMAKKNNQVTGNVGMYYVCYRLSERGLNVMPTARNARGIDILAYDDDCKFTTIQVKTLSKPSAIPLGKSRDNLMGDYWCVVVGQKDSRWSVFVMTKKEVHDLAQQDSKGSWWVEYKEFGKTDAFLGKWNRIRCTKR